MLPSVCVRDLGVYLDSELDWETHIFNVCSVAKRLCAWVLNIFYTRDREVLLTVFNSLVRSRVEYCCQIWSPAKIKLIGELENIQRRFTKRISGMYDFDYWDRLKQLNILSLQRRREKMILILIWRIKNGMASNDIQLEFGLGRSNLKTDSASKAVIKPLPKTRGKALSLFENSFMVKGAKLWNYLPSSLREIQHLHLFVHTLDQYFKLIPDKPPVNGYYHVNDNSLISYRCPKFNLDSVLKL